MKKILAINGSTRNGETDKFLNIFIKKLENFGYETKTINLREKNIGFCKGCLVCFKKGEEICPQKDDFTDVYKNMLESDAVIFSTPVYAMNVSAYLKNFFDRASFVYHRPIFFDKIAMPFTAQGIMGDKKVLKYLEETSKYWGFTVEKGLGLTTPPGLLTKASFDKIEKFIDNKVKSLIKRIESGKIKKPSLTDVIGFRLNRTIKPYLSEVMKRDNDYFIEKGWDKSQYYNRTRIGAFKNIIGILFDLLGKKIGKRITKEIDLYKSENNLKRLN